MACEKVSRVHNSSLIRNLSEVVKRKLVEVQWWTLWIVLALFTLFDIQMKSNAHIDGLKLSFIMVIYDVFEGSPLKGNAFITGFSFPILLENRPNDFCEQILVYSISACSNFLDAVLTGLLSALHKSVHIKFNGETIFQGSTFELCGFDLLAGERKVCQGKLCSSSIETEKEVAVKVQLLLWGYI